MSQSVLFFDEIQEADAARVGGKGAMLAWLWRHKFPVPEGCVVTTGAFDGDELRPEARAAVLAAFERVREGGAVAVRSSAVGEDGAKSSFAGAFESVLDVRDEAGLWAAIARVRASRHAERVGSYAGNRGLADAPLDVAVVIQRLIPAEHAGVLFTADPVTGDRGVLVGNFVAGLGEGVVSGEQAASEFRLYPPRGRYVGPPALKAFAPDFFALGEHIQAALGGPQDLEWAIADRQLWLLQARPITTLTTYDPATGEHNDSLGGDFLWSNGNLGEAVPDVMTPCTWSLMQRGLRLIMAGSYVTDVVPNGNIGGRFYMNLSLVAALGSAFGAGEAFMRRTMEQAFGRVPPDVAIPPVPLSRWQIIRPLLPVAIQVYRRASANRQAADAFLASSPAIGRALVTEAAGLATREALLAFWRDRLEPYFVRVCEMMEAGRQDGAQQVFFERKLRKLAGVDDAQALMVWGATAGGALASLGLLEGLDRLARGEIDREAFAFTYGHRGPHEFEVAFARPGEDPAWIDRQLATHAAALADLRTMQARQQAAHEAAWSRLEASHPRQAGRLRRQLAKAAAAARYREVARSECIRGFWAMRAFALQAGKVLGLGEDVFFLEWDELLEVLADREQVLATLPARKATHARYSALPPYPALIRGRFDPFLWAADPDRRSDLYDPTRPPPADTPTITGFPGAAGVVEGLARVVRTAEEAEALLPGEVLVTIATNVGWTPLFPRAAAVVTDVGAPLSHAAIVARELGIPAVVGCGNATMRLATGDRVRVNGVTGVVELLS